MRAHDDVGERLEDRQLVVVDDVAHAVVVVQAVLVLEHVERGAAQVPGADAVDQRGGVHELAARGVDHDGALRHACDRVGVDDVVVGVVGVHVQRDDVGRGQDLIEARIGGHRGGLVVLVGVEGHDLAAEARQTTDYGGADAAGAEHAHGQLRQVASDLAAQGVVLHMRALEDVGQATQRGQGKKQRVVGDRGGRVADVVHMQAELARVGEVDVVVADAAA